MRGSWFPLNKALIEKDYFKKLPPMHKLYFLYIISEYNLRGKFYKSDLEVAVTIGTSVDTIRRARKDLQREGFIITTPGYLSKKNKPLATTYCEVDFYQVCEGEFFAPIHRYAFETLLFQLRSGKLGHKEVLQYVYICYLEAKYRDNGEFFISKRELIELTGMPEAPAAVLRLNEIEIFGYPTPSIFGAAVGPACRAAGYGQPGQNTGDTMKIKTLGAGQGQTKGR